MRLLEKYFLITENPTVTYHGTAKPILPCARGSQPPEGVSKDLSLWDEPPEGAVFPEGPGTTGSEAPPENSLGRFLNLTHLIIDL